MLAKVELYELLELHLPYDLLRVTTVPFWCDLGGAHFYGRDEVQIYSNGIWLSHSATLPINAVYKFVNPSIRRSYNFEPPHPHPGPYTFELHGTHMEISYAI